LDFEIRAKARIRPSNCCQFGSLGEAGHLPVSDAAGCQESEQWKPSGNPLSMTYGTDSKAGVPPWGYGFAGSAHSSHPYPGQYHCAVRWCWCWPARSPAVRAPWLPAYYFHGQPEPRLGLSVLAAWSYGPLPVPDACLDGNVRWGTDPEIRSGRVGTVDRMCGGPEESGFRVAHSSAHHR